MINKIISEEAIKNNIKIFGFTKNAFVALFPYYVNEKFGNISLYARGKDYHKVVKEILTPVQDKILSLGAKKAIIHCDNGEYNDRYAAYKAGLGFYGKNKMLINEDYGSFFFIGQIVTDLEFKEAEPKENLCKNCNRCVNACITGVLKEEFVDTKCLSGITQKKGELTEVEKRYIKIGKSCFGCDVCQLACPFNQNLKNNALEDFLAERKLNLTLADIDDLSERKFKEKFGNYAFAWRGKKVLKRNLEILKELDE